MAKVLDSHLIKKEQDLENILKKLGQVIIAYSGGVDSSYLLSKAFLVLGKKNVVAITLNHPGFFSSDLKDAKNLNQYLKVKHLIIKEDESHYKKFIYSPLDRCYICKKNNFKNMIKLAKELKIKNIIDGTNYSDDPKNRPGMKALNELGIISPLRLAKLTKDDIRALSKEMRLPTFKKEARACLYTRIKHGEKITPYKLKNVKVLEEFLTELGIKELRVRVKEFKVSDKNGDSKLQKETSENMIFVLELGNYKRDIEIVKDKRNKILKKLDLLKIKNFYIDLR